MTYNVFGGTLNKPYSTLFYSSWKLLQWTQMHGVTVQIRSSSNNKQCLGLLPKKKGGGTKHKVSPPLQKVGGTSPFVHPWIYAHEGSNDLHQQLVLKRQLDKCVNVRQRLQWWLRARSGRRRQLLQCSTSCDELSPTLKRTPSFSQRENNSEYTVRSSA